MHFIFILSIKKDGTIKYLIKIIPLTPFYIISKGELKPKHEDKLIEKIFDAYGERWKEKEIEENIRLHLTNVKKCMEHRDLVCSWFMIYAFLNQTETSHCMPS